MMKVSTGDYSLVFNRLGDLVEITGSPESLECFRQTVELAGAAEGLAGARTGSGRREYLERPNGPENRIQADEGTVALFLSFEALNYL